MYDMQICIAVLATQKAKGPARDPPLSNGVECELGEVHQRGCGGDRQTKDH